jgi:hypothetical protein
MEAEVIARYRAWVNSLPVFARDDPYLNYQGKWWSPNEVLREMELGTPAGKHFIEAEQKLMEQGS